MAAPRMRPLMQEPAVTPRRSPGTSFSVQFIALRPSRGARPVGRLARPRRRPHTADHASRLCAPATNRLPGLPLTFDAAPALAPSTPKPGTPMSRWTTQELCTSLSAAFGADNVEESPTADEDRKSTRLNYSNQSTPTMP